LLTRQNFYSHWGPNRSNRFFFFSYGNSMPIFFTDARFEFLIKKKNTVKWSGVQKYSQFDHSPLTLKLPRHCHIKVQYTDQKTFNPLISYGVGHNVRSRDINGPDSCCSHQSVLKRRSYLRHAINACSERAVCGRAETKPAPIAVS
jgi:hypothetical protein